MAGNTRKSMPGRTGWGLRERREGESVPRRWREDIEESGAVLIVGAEEGRSLGEQSPGGQRGKGRRVVVRLYIARSITLTGKKRRPDSCCVRLS